MTSLATSPATVPRCRSRAILSRQAAAPVGELARGGAARARHDVAARVRHVDVGTFPPCTPPSVDTRAQRANDGASGTSTHGHTHSHIFIHLSSLARSLSLSLYQPLQCCERDTMARHRRHGCARHAEVHGEVVASRVGIECAENADRTSRKAVSTGKR